MVRTTQTTDPMVRGPASGRMIQPFRLSAGDGREMRSRDFSQRSNLVLIFHHGSGCGACHAFIEALEAHTTEFANAAAKILLIGPDAEDMPRCSIGGSGDVILALYDPAATVAGTHDLNPPSIVVADRFGEIWAAWEGGVDHLLPDTDEVIEWLEFIEIQCPECHPPEPWE